MIHVHAAAVKSIKTVMENKDGGWDITKTCRISNEQCMDKAEEIYVDSCGRKGLGEIRSAKARRGSTAARGKRSIFPERFMHHFPICSDIPFDKTLLYQPLFTENITL